MTLDRRQLASYAVIAGFMAVTVGHVAAYTGSFEPDGWRWLGWVYALAVDVGIIACAWMTQWKTTHLAWPAYIILIIGSGLLNVAQVAPWKRDLGAWIYAILPTVAQGLLGFLARDASAFTKRRNDSEAVARLRAELKQVRTELAQVGAMKEPSADLFGEICADLDGGAPKTARAANRLLNDCGYYAVPDSTVRNWLESVTDSVTN